MKQLVHPARRLEGTIATPADKSISHRAAILNSLAPGEAVVDNFSDSGDCRSTLRCLRALGVSVERISIGSESQETPGLRIRSPGFRGLAEPTDVLNAANSGTTMRLLAGVLAAAPFLSVITGDRSLRSRPMSRIVHPLRLMGAHILGRSGDSLAPLTIKGGSLKGVEYTLPVASAQVKSSLILAGLFAHEQTLLLQPALSRDHTERMLEAMGARLTREDLLLAVTPGSDLKPLNVKVPGDISAAAFWMVAAAAHPNARVRLPNVGINPSRTGVIDALKAMGARITVENPRVEGGEPVADLCIQSSELEGTELSGDLIPRAIDEIPVLAVAACFARGTTVIRNAQELRVKESDRLLSMAKELSRLGARIRELPDGLIIEGTGRLAAGTCRSYGDHRIAMTLGVAGLLAEEDIAIEGAHVAGVSYPRFWQDLAHLASASA